MKKKEIEKNVEENIIPLQEVETNVISLEEDKQEEVQEEEEYSFFTSEEDYELIIKKFNGEEKKLTVKIPKKHFNEGTSKEDLDFWNKYAYINFHDEFLSSFFGEDLSKNTLSEKVLLVLDYSRIDLTQLSKLDLFTANLLMRNKLKMLDVKLIQVDEDLFNIDLDVVSDENNNRTVLKLKALEIEDYYTLQQIFRNDDDSLKKCKDFLLKKLEYDNLESILILLEDSLVLSSMSVALHAIVYKSDLSFVKKKNITTKE